MVRRSLVAKSYLYATAVLVALFLAALTAGRLLLDQGRLDLLGHQALFIAHELERSGPTPARVHELEEGLHVRIRFTTSDYPPLLASDKVVFEPALLPGPSWRHYWVRLDRGDTTLGALELNFEPARPNRPYGHLVGALIWLGLLAILIVPPLSLWVLRPLRNMVAVAERLGAGDLATPVPRTRRDELGTLEAAFENLRERVLGMLRQKERLLGDISHELRGPLSRMTVALGLLNRPPEDAQALAALDREIQAMEALIGELLTLARAQTPETLAREPLDLATLAAQLAGAREASFRQAGRSLELALEPAPASGDARLLTRALGNLLDNALKYGGDVRVETGCREGQAFCRVLDDGPGVAPEQLDQLFEPFYRPDDSRSRATGGVGLGLAIVKAIAEGHAGQASLSPREGGGTRAELTLPARDC